MKFQVAKGHRDFFGRDAILRNKIRGTLSEIFERYGFIPLETPMIEDLSTISHKGGGEIQKEVFRLSDQGNRELALRFDQTLPLARFIASNPQITFPFKRYAIGPVFRDGPTQPEQGRYRSFTQCDVDILGVKDMTAEAELMALAKDAFAELGVGDVEFKINSRKLLDGILDKAGVPKSARTRAIITLDKMDKIGPEGVIEQLNELRAFDEESKLSDNLLKELFRETGATDRVNSLKGRIISEVGEEGFNYISEVFSSAKSNISKFQDIANFSTKGSKLLTSDMIKTLDELIINPKDRTLDFLRTEVISERGIEGLNELTQIMEYANALNFDCVTLDPSLARGLDYYTGTAIETYARDKSKISSAVLAGGRFDDMVGSYRGSEVIPAVGFSFGLERIAMLLDNQESPSTTAQLYLIPVGGTTSNCLKIAHDLRSEGINVEMELGDRRVKKAMKTANERGVPYVGIVGDDELFTKSISLKHMQSGKQQQVPINKIKEYL